MRRADAIAKLKSTEPVLRRHGIRALYLFGSHARDEASSNSDIDVFVDFEAGVGASFITFMDALESIQRAIGNHIDFGTRTGLHPLLRDKIEREAIKVF